jgi:hypothetical protein
LIPAVVDESYSRCSCTKGRFWSDKYQSS